ncbi:MAG TPA: haloalkane dehalogenase [Alphaproteobacteria bacterium]|nr:haloalkane dehalogenase [Alphaproteobacteria bacterium]HAJ46090.1 haloalkane dehalogenase [Alphaproteobacteria bacterium]
MTQEVLRTPEERFASLPDYPYTPHYLQNSSAGGLRQHYIDARPEGGPGQPGVVLCLHGEPTWAFLYRRMIPVFTRAGHRVVAPDWFGFGRSDKPVDDRWYSFGQHRRSMLAFIEAMDLRDITLVVQDWGGLLGLTLPMEMPERFSRLLVMNTCLATGAPISPGFDAWRAYANANPDMAVGPLMKRATPILTEAEVAAYDAPFPDQRYKAGVRRFPQMVMTSPEMEGADISRHAVQWWWQAWRGQTFMAVGAQDPVLGPPVMEQLRSQIRGCPSPMIIPDAGHFVQEWGAPVAEHALATFARG